MFIGRTRELASLKMIFQSPRASIAVVYGRRRIGKSSLITEAARGCRFFSFEGLENQSTRAQKKIFIQQLQSVGVASDLSPSATWYELLRTLAKLADPQEATVILLDELQWFANYRSELISNLKLVWDQLLSKHNNIKLVLCGSVASFMVRKVIHSRALYGRTDLTLHLQSLKLVEAQQLLAGKSIEETTLAYLLVGGVPKYLQLLTDKDSVLRSLSFHCQGPHAYFAHEYQKIFTSHFGDNPAYERIVRYLNERAHGATRDMMATALKLSNSGQLSDILSNLEFAGIIKGWIPFHNKSNSRMRRYQLVDHFMRFYLTFIEPLISSREIDRVDFLAQVFPSPKMASWLGTSFEILCLNHAHEIAGALEFSGVRYTCGPYFQPSSKKEVGGVQLDLVFQREDRVFTVCEVKYQTEPQGRAVATQLDEAISKISLFKNRTVQKILISYGPVAQSLQDGITFSRVLTLEDLFRSTSQSNLRGR